MEPSGGDTWIPEGFNTELQPLDVMRELQGKKGGLPDKSQESPHFLNQTVISQSFKTKMETKRSY